MGLNDEQKMVVECQGHVVALSCPGSGKTYVVEQKVKTNLENNPESNNLVLTFTRAAAQNLKRKITNSAEKKHWNRVKSGTFHSVALHQIRAVGFNGSIAQEHQIKQIVQGILKACNLNMEVGAAIAFIDKCRADVNYKPLNDDLGALYIQYENLLSKYNILDFSGILLEVVKLMQSGNISPIPCSHLYIDEAQDMDSVQVAWCIEHVKAGAIITIVGDDDQSIYKFRNAQGLDGMMRFKHELGAEVITLGTNYRCHEEILRAAGNVIANNKKRVKKVLTAARGLGGTVELMQFQGAAQEANKVVRNILKSCASNPNPDPDKYVVGVKEEEWAVLTRNNHNLSILAAALVANGIPHVFKEKNLWSEEPVCYALDLMQAIINNNLTGLNMALNYIGINQGILDKCWKKFFNDYECFVVMGDEKYFTEFAHEISSKLSSFALMIRTADSNLFKNRDSHAVKAVFNWLIEVLKLKAMDEGCRNKHKKEIKLLMCARDILSKKCGPLKKRLQRIAMNSGSEKEATQGVYLGSLHSSKGLQYKNVWMLQMNSDVIPDLKNIGGELEEEERRLFYVGMTRAENSLFISCTKEPSKFALETKLNLKRINN